MPSVAERIAGARLQLVASGIDPAEAALDAEVLARELLGWDRATLLLQKSNPEPPGFEAAYGAALARRAAREPVAQIIGRREFWGLEFEVTSDVLVPRPETEIIVDEALAFAREAALRRVIDVGTGSGCLAVAIAHELPDVRVVATDVSAAALEVARRNAVRHGVADRVDLLRADLLEGISEPADLIVSNPPYVPDRDAEFLQPEVVRYEPRDALFGGPTGLEVIERLLGGAWGRLAEGGRLVVEFGFGQHEAVVQLAQQSRWDVVRVRQDLQAIPRAIVLTRTTHG